MMPYHHGDLRRAVLDAAVAAITERGPAGLSLRDLARRAGVSHAGPVHHFGDKAGVLTALAAEGYDLLAGTLVDAEAETGEFVEVGVAYVRFAVEHRAHFEVMFRPDLYHADDPELVAARDRAGQALARGVGSMGERAGPDARITGVAAWSLVHGFATLWLTGALADDLTGDLETAAREVAARLFPDDA
ncbi:TetR/AcrR family transcriptional regulator [Amycolatopsis suaedae]|uniref:TetR/AcrR family transcriptional regulator n=1 Tax=Amycolatopsis suaedae TaxID=2510978 RepID=A0A4V2EMG0_9PSEU|nr:TetR/AcrR family transcriptional regulator [Amycolatopsis suaedae]RZQ64935.1 TetR/AcrR family transcriptional regulator [Amycolatopsis suaedae]